MSTTPTVPRTAPDPTRRALAIAAVPIAAAGPLAVAVLRGVLPYDTTDDGAALLGKVAAAPGAASAVVWLGLVAVLTLPLGVLIASRLAIRARPALGMVAAVLAWLGFGSLGMLVAADQVAAAGTAAGLPIGTLTTLTGAMAAHPAAAAAEVVFVVGHVLGAVLLGIALWRAVPRWAAVALIVSQPLHLLVAVFWVNHAVDALAWTLTAVGFAAAAVTLLRAERTAGGAR